MQTVVSAHIAGRVVQMSVSVGDRIAEGDAVVILECLTMEIPIFSTAPGTVTQICVGKNEEVGIGEALVWLETDATPG